MSDVEGDVPSAAPVEAAGPMGINEAIQEVLKQVRAQTILIIHSTHTLFLRIQYKFPYLGSDCRRSRQRAEGGCQGSGQEASPALHPRRELRRAHVQEAGHRPLPGENRRQYGPAEH